MMANYPPYQGYMQQQMMAPRPQPYMDYPAIKGRPVSSFEEARASMIDFDGSVFYFPDLANQKIYTKQINIDGTPSIKIYELAQAPTPQPSISVEDLVSKEEFNKTIENLLQQINNLRQPTQPAVYPEQPVAKAPAADFNF